MFALPNSLSSFSFIIRPRVRALTHTANVSFTTIPLDLMIGIPCFTSSRFVANTAPNSHQFEVLLIARLTPKLQIVDQFPTYPTPSSSSQNSFLLFICRITFPHPYTPCLLCLLSISSRNNTMR